MNWLACSVIYLLLIKDLSNLGVYFIWRSGVSYFVLLFCCVADVQRSVASGDTLDTLLTWSWDSPVG